MGQVLAVGQVYEAFFGKGKKSILGFYGLRKKTYHRINRDILWNVLLFYGIFGRLLNGGGREGRGELGIPCSNPVGTWPFFKQSSSSLRNSHAAI